jgi:hypothetical protein
MIVDQINDNLNITLVGVDETQLDLKQLLTIVTAKKPAEDLPSPQTEVLNCIEVFTAGHDVGSSWSLRPPVIPGTPMSLGNPWSLENPVIPGTPMSLGTPWSPEPPVLPWTPWTPGPPGPFATTWSLGSLMSLKRSVKVAFPIATLMFSSSSFSRLPSRSQQPPLNQTRGLLVSYGRYQSYILASFNFFILSLNRSFVSKKVY